MKKEYRWRITVADLTEVRGLHHEVRGAVIEARNGAVIEWLFRGTSVKSNDGLGFSHTSWPCNFQKSADDLKIPKYVVAAIQGFCRTLIAADKKSVSLPVDWFDARVSKKAGDEVQCSPESE